MFGYVEVFRHTKSNYFLYIHAVLTIVVSKYMCCVEEGIYTPEYDVYVRIIIIFHKQKHFMLFYVQHTLCLSAIVPECPKAELSERIHTLRQRIAFVRGQIDILADSYENSKQYIIFQRYRLMKAMIKQILTNCIDLRSNYNC